MSNPYSTATPEYTTPTSSASPTATGVQSLHPYNHHDAEEHHHHPHPLLPGLPDHVAQLCLSLVPPSLLFSICHSWRRLIYSPSFPPFLSLYALFLPTGIQSHLSNSVHFSSFDPILCKWLPLPIRRSPLPLPPPLLRLPQVPHPSCRRFRQSHCPRRNLRPVPSCLIPTPSFQLSISEVDSRSPALGPTPMVRSWHVPRVVYVASGIGSHYDNDVARSVEKWDLSVQRHHRHRHRRRWRWEKIGSLRDCKFSREAIDAVGWKGKLCMVNVKGAAAKQGIIYDVESESWEEMREGMLAGWRGPAAAMDEETLYVVDESKGWLKKYDHVKDAWVGVVENEKLRGAQQVAAAGGRVCVLCADGGSIAVVDVAAVPPARLWTVEAPAGVQAVGIHILPRLSHSDS
ncbi:UNVERIFIED_CONTAM: F-box/kelch-repeat protein SKIP25 [Sesamum radiatum]|uniref:F-box/kelch-repeat protein SKIP25 n=1 Tax=Sesamum radiatum TaxID=300843 RepID=A0AAW2MGF3_SESRA